MSCDAKVWQEEDDSWSGLHDGDCHVLHEGTEYDLVDILTSIERCMGGHSIRWRLRAYPGGKAGLVGWHA